MILLLPMSFKKDKHKYSKDRFIIEDDYWLGKIGPVYETKDKETIRSYNYHNYFRSMEVHESKLTKKWWDYQRKVNEKKQIEISLYTNHIPYFYFDRETLTFMNNKEYHDFVLEKSKLLFKEKHKKIGIFCHDVFHEPIEIHSLEQALTLFYQQKHNFLGGYLISCLLLLSFSSSSSSSRFILF